jgi:hypothetical protein
MKKVGKFLPEIYINQKRFSRKKRVLIGGIYLMVLQSIRLLQKFSRIVYIENSRSGGR